MNQPIDQDVFDSQLLRSGGNIQPHQQTFRCAHLGRTICSDLKTQPAEPMRAQMKDLPDDLAAIQKPTARIKEIVDQPHILAGDVDGLAEGFRWVSISKMLLEIGSISSCILDRTQPASLLKAGQ